MAMKLPPANVQVGLIALALVIGLVVAVLRGCGVIMETME